MWRSVGLRAWPAVMGGVERRQSSWGWGVGWSESENAVEKTSGGSRGSRARGKTCSVPVRGFCDGVAGGGVECRARFDMHRAPVQSFQFRRSAIPFSHLSRVRVVVGCSKQKRNRASVGVPIPRVAQADARRSHPTDHPGLGWAHSPGAERGRWVSPRGRAPQSAPPATTGLTQATAARPLATGSLALSNFRGGADDVCTTSPLALHIPEKSTTGGDPGKCQKMIESACPRCAKLRFCPQ